MFPLTRAWEFLEARMRSPYAPLFLFLYSFVETLVTLIPIDPFALAVMAADRARVYQTAFYIVLGSLFGALVGYWIGDLAFDTFAPALLGGAYAQHALAHLRVVWFQHEALIVFATAFVPLPKTPTILVGGFLGGSVPIFVLAWVLGRALHFCAEAFIVRLSTTETLSTRVRVFSVASVVLGLIIVGYLIFSLSGLSG